MRSIVVLAVLIVIPIPSYAAVTINEIAWMGSVTSPNHEWIELYNSGPSIDVTGWQLTDENNISIFLSGTIAGNSYVVLERTSEASSPVDAFSLYTGALSNAGARLILYRADGGVEDQVDGRDEWSSIGGNNETKATAQYTTSGWITAEPTPGTVNSREPEVVEDTTTSASSGSANRAEPAVRQSLELILPDNTLEVDLIIPDQVFVNQPVTFAAVPSGVGSVIENSLTYRWNFGDMNIATGNRPIHAYSYPGTYKVVVEAKYARQSAYHTQEITVLPVDVSLTKNAAGDVQINNDSPYQLDVSHFRLRAQTGVELPDQTWLLPRQTITIPADTLGQTVGRLIMLYDQQGAVVSSISPTVNTRFNSIQSNGTPVASRVPSVGQSNSDFSFSTAAEDISVHEQEGERVAEVPKRENTVAATPASESVSWTIVALVALLSFTSVVVLMKPLSTKDSLDSHE